MINKNQLKEQVKTAYWHAHTRHWTSKQLHERLHKIYSNPKLTQYDRGYIDGMVEVHERNLEIEHRHWYKHEDSSYELLPSKGWNPTTHPHGNFCGGGLFWKNSTACYFGDAEPLSETEREKTVRQSREITRRRDRLQEYLDKNPQSYTTFEALPAWREFYLVADLVRPLDHGYPINFAAGYTKTSAQCYTGAYTGGGVLRETLRRKDERTIPVVLFDPTLYAWLGE